MTPVSQFLTVMAQSFDDSDIDTKLAAFEELKERVSESDLFARIGGRYLLGRY